MGFQVGKKKGPMAEINVTPLVDVMLVLLVIFMITAPLMYNGIQLQLPKTSKVNSLNLANNQVILSVSSAGEYFLDKQKYLPEEVLPEIKHRLKKFQTSTVFIRASSEIKYGKVAKLMATLKKNGISNISLVTEVEP
jgi:biopolymer transport protein TolR